MKSVTATILIKDDKVLSPKRQLYTDVIPTQEAPPEAVGDDE